VSLGAAWAAKAAPSRNASAPHPTVCELGVNCGLANLETFDPLFLSPKLNKYHTPDGQVLAPLHTRHSPD
jgi:hypothetical protein